MSSDPSITSVLRALAVLGELNRRHVSALHELHIALGLPKSTLARILKTLCEAGYIRNNKQRGGYQVTSLVKSLSCGFHRDPLIVEAARPWAIDFTQRYQWPIAIAVLDADVVRVCFTTNPDSPVSPFHGAINSRMRLLTRALGRAYLAFCADEERDLLLTALSASDHPEDQEAKQREKTLAMLRSIRKAGFAMRDATVEPRSSGTVAIPMKLGDKILATAGMSFFKSAVTQEKLMSDYVPALQKMAHHIEQSAATLLESHADLSLT